MGVVVGWVNDVTLMLGCALGISDLLTALVLVAAGTSIPDTFASKIAATNDASADNSITNVTGSNSVNVFLGLGLPWTMGALYWHFEEGSEEWKQKCCSFDPELVKEYNGGLILSGESIGLPTATFLTLSLMGAVLLTIRREFCGGELGGTWRKTSIIFLLSGYVSVILSVATQAEE